MTKGQRNSESVCACVCRWGISMAPPASTGSCCYRCSLSAATHYHSKQVPLFVCVCVAICVWVQDIQQALIFTTVFVCACLLKCEVSMCVRVCRRRGGLHVPMHILMQQQVAVAAAENGFHSGGARWEDTLHLPPDSSGYECVSHCASTQMYTNTLPPPPTPRCVCA